MGTETTEGGVTDRGQALGAEFLEIAERLIGLRTRWDAGELTPREADALLAAIMDQSDATSRTYGVGRYGPFAHLYENTNGPE